MVIQTRLIILCLFLLSLPLGTNAYETNCEPDVTETLKNIYENSPGKITSAEPHWTPVCFDYVIGPHWQSDNTLLTGFGPLSIVASLPGDPANTDKLKHLTKTKKDWANWLEKSSYEPRARQALAIAMDRIDTMDEESLPTSRQLRRMVRGGWPQVMESAALKNMREAILETEKMQTLARYQSADGNTVFELKENAFGEELTVLTTSSEQTFSRQAIYPTFLEDAIDTADGLVQVTTLKVEELRSVDEIRLERVTDSAMFVGQERLASWSRQHGFRLHTTDWRHALPIDTENAGENIHPNAFPPHVSIADHHGDPALLITPHGVFQPSDNIDELTESARLALPTAEYLDLLGQLFFTYAYDSPDVTEPYLIGTSTISGDLHQTPQQTLNTLSGGNFRGDCDDLSELYHAIRGDPLTHVVGLPMHAATAWVTQNKPEQWQTFVLHTGEPKRFVGASPEQSLLNAYGDFDYEEHNATVLNPDQLEVLLRFGDDNTRATYFLGSRIFYDQAYANTLISIQEMWSNWLLAQTYHLLEKEFPDDKTAPIFAEFAGLSEFMGRFNDAARYYSLAVEHADPESQTDFQLRRLHNVLMAQDHQYARNLIQTIRQNHAPQDSLPGVFELAIASTVNLAESGYYDFELLDVPLEILDQSPVWYDGNKEFERLETFIEVSLGMVRKSRGAYWPNQRLYFSYLSAWFNEVGFTDENYLGLDYQKLGHFMRVQSSSSEWAEHLKQIDGVDVKAATHPRPEEPGTRQHSDYAWLKMSTQFWAQDFAWERSRNPKLSKEDAVVMLDRITVAARLAEEHGYASSEDVHSSHIAEVVIHLIHGDWTNLRHTLQKIAESGDRALTENLGYEVADSSRLISPENLRRGTRIISEELPQRWILMQIMWRIRAIEGADRAIAVAETLESLHPDNSEFARELKAVRK